MSKLGFKNFIFVKCCARRQLPPNCFFQRHFSKARWPPIKKYKIETGLKIPKYTIKKLALLTNFCRTCMTNPSVQLHSREGCREPHNSFLVRKEFNFHYFPAQTEQPTIGVSVQYKRFSLQCTFYIIHCTVYTFYIILFSEHYTLCATESFLKHCT